MGWFYLNLSTAINATIVSPSTLVGIAGDPGPVATPGLYVRDAVVDASAGTVRVPVLLGGPAGAASASTVSVKYTTSNGSAVAGTDYTASSGTLTFGPGETVKNITVPIIDRSGAAPSRSFSITLSGPRMPSSPTGPAWSPSEPAAPPRWPRPASPRRRTWWSGEADGYVDLPVTLSAPGTKTVTVNYADLGRAAAATT